MDSDLARTRSPGEVDGTPGRVSNETLHRLLDPRSVAIVGARESDGAGTIPALLEADVELFLINRHRATVYGRETYRDLAEVGVPIDAILAMVNAEASVGVVEQAAGMGAGGVVVYAGGFAEEDGNGAALQDRLVAAAGDSLAVLGPNCLGFINAKRRLVLCGAPPLPLSKGGIGVVTQSGALLASLVYGAEQRRLGFSYLISCGNEASTDVVDYIDFLVEDPDTVAICLILEKIRRPEAFIRAAERARDHDKPIVALKLGRTERAREIARSHTGAIVGDSWVYEAFFRQLGIVSALDSNDLLDRVVLFDQLPPDRWRAVDGLVIFTASGGGAAMFSDACADEGIDLPPLEHLKAQVAEIVPHAATQNPVDLTGFLRLRLDAFASLVRACVAAPEVDALLLLYMIAENTGQYSTWLMEPFAEWVRDVDKLVLIASCDDAPAGTWTADLLAAGIGVGRGLRTTTRALGAMREFIRARRRPASERETAVVWPRPAITPVVSVVGPILPFEAAMDVLVKAGIPIAPFVVVDASTRPTSECLPFSEPFVVKLADVPHRTDIGAVRHGIRVATLPGTVEELRELAAGRGLPRDVVIQPHVTADGEAFVGVQADGELGPLVVCGLGGIFVGVQKRFAGRVAPFDHIEAMGMLEELEATGVLDGVRGGRAWDRAQLTRVLRGCSELAVATRDWLESMDVNPLMQGPDGFVAVDALVILRSPEPDHPAPGPGDLGYAGAPTADRV